MNILVVEDTPADLKLMRAILTSAGHQVDEARTAEKALATIPEGPPQFDPTGPEVAWDRWSGVGLAISSRIGRLPISNRSRYLLLRSSD